MDTPSSSPLFSSLFLYSASSSARLRKRRLFSASCHPLTMRLPCVALNWCSNVYIGAKKSMQTPKLRCMSCPPTLSISEQVAYILEETHDGLYVQARDIVLPCVIELLVHCQNELVHDHVVSFVRDSSPLSSSLPLLSVFASSAPC